MKRIAYSPNETRQILANYDIDTHRYCKFLELSVAIQKDLFKKTSSLMSKSERIDFELNMLQGELALLIVRKASFW